ncbi:hypothetical protein N806_29580 [Rhodococcus sp. P27]|nr:hypothetical protein N806_29580 [Rhodococcus sp. P27]
MPSKVSTSNIRTARGLLLTSRQSTRTPSASAPVRSSALRLRASLLMSGFGATPGKSGPTPSDSRLRSGRSFDITSSSVIFESWRFFFQPNILPLPHSGAGISAWRFALTAIVCRGHSRSLSHRPAAMGSPPAVVDGLGQGTCLSDES